MTEPPDRAPGSSDDPEPLVPAAGSAAGAGDDAPAPGGEPAEQRAVTDPRRLEQEPGARGAGEDAAVGPVADTPESDDSGSTGRRLAVSTAFFSAATGLSRIAGLVREVVAANYFGIKGPMSAFTIAFQVPNLVRSLFADAALQAAFVPVFTEHLEAGRRRDAFALATTLLFGIGLVLGALTAVLILAAPLLVPIFAPGFSGRLEDLTITLTQLLFPILVLLGISGLLVGMLNSYERFAAGAIAPLFWNLAIIGTLIGLVPVMPEGDEIYAYAIGILVGTVVQLAIPAWDLRNTPFSIVRSLSLRRAWQDAGVRRVLVLMLPVTVSLGLINFNLSINSFFGTLVSEQAPAAIDKAFRIYMLPQGIFSVAVATVLFPTLSRYAARGELAELRATMGSGMRQIVLMLLPATAAILVLSEPMIRLVYERGAFDGGQTDLVATALFWFAFSLPFNGMFLLFTRTFFSLQRPWVPTAISAGNLLVTAGLAAALYEPFGVAGIVGATAAATALSVLAQALVLRGQLGGVQAARLASSSIRIAIASTILAAVAYGVWTVLDDALGRSLGAQVLSMAGALTAGLAVYIAAILGLRVPEAAQIARTLRRRATG
ncbi:MAG: murein biosynthesis integral membrane protein MurJ [Solirubrobacterales bacterium]